MLLRVTEILRDYEGVGPARGVKAFKDSSNLAS